MKPMRSQFILALGIAGVATTALVVAQVPQSAVAKAAPAAAAKKPYGTLNFQTSVGSFKILGVAEQPAEGTLTINFNGTVLISGLEGTATPSGSVRREYDNADHKKTIYFGKGKLVVNGKYRGIQFFGRELTGRYVGHGAVRLYGEFDKNLQTGFFWFEGGEKRPWATGGIQVFNPEITYRATPQAEPRVRDAGKG
jgi:hypothetical protein